jgi:hypothetical protein
MTVIELPDSDAAALRAKATAAGLTLEAWLQRLAGTEAAPATGTVPQERPIWEVIADNMSDVPDDEFHKLPQASQIDHYLYGHPK